VPACYNMVPSYLHLLRVDMMDMTPESAEWLLTVLVCSTYSRLHIMIFVACQTHTAEPTIFHSMYGSQLYYCHATVSNKDIISNSHFAKSVCTIIIF
jgi:hypothetical protein